MSKKKAKPVYRESTLDDLVSGGFQYSANDAEVEPTPEKKPRGFGGIAADIGLSALKGAISVPEAAVGLADIPTGGRVGRALEGVGFRPKEAKAMLDDQYTAEQKQAFQNVQQAEGFGGKFVAALQNPSVVGHSIVESLPSMGAGGVVGRGVLAAAPGVGALGAAALGEGIVGGGSAAEQIRQETPDGLLTPKQAGLAALSGAGTAAFGALGNKVAKSLGIHDVDVMLIGAVQNPASAKGIVRRVLEGAASEGILEELPQSIQEQVLQNAALGKPLDEGVDQAAVLGLLSGAAMGGGANIVGGGHARAANDSLLTPPPVPPAPVLGLPEPVITVDPTGTAQTADQRQAANDAVLDDRAARGGLVERGPLTKAANAAGADIADVESKPVGALARAAAVAAPAQPAAINPEILGALNESTSVQAPTDEVGQPVPGEGGAQLSGAPAEAQRPSMDGGLAGGVLRQETPVAADALAQPAAQLDAVAPPPAAPQVFPTYEEADTFRREQKARGASIQALPVPAEGGFTLAAKGMPGYEQGEALRDERRAAKERADAGVLDGDIVNGKGFPFTIRLPANNAAKKAGPGHEVVAVKGGFVVRKAAPQPETTTDVQAPAEPAAAPPAAPAAAAPAQESAPAVAPAVVGGAPAVRLRRDAAPTPPVASLAGKPIDAEWTAFSPQSGTKGVPRADMPQIKAEHRGAMVNFLNARGIAHEQVEIPAGDLKPTQAEFSQARVEKAKAFTGGDRSILVSADGHVLDGHHQWLAKVDAGEPVKAIRLDAPIARLVDEVKQFPSAKASEGATAPAAALDMDVQAQIDAMMMSGSAQTEVRVPAGVEVPESVFRAQMNRRADPGYSMKNDKATGETIFSKTTAPVAAPATAPAPAAAPVVPAGVQRAQKAKANFKARLAEQAALADYFAPGNIVKSYAYDDRVLEFTPATADQSWSVKVEAVVKKDGVWVPDPRDNRERVHNTMPTEKELAAGPIERAAAPAAPTAAPAPTASGNTIFTEDAAAAARARMKKKLGTVQSGIDPELLQDGITLAGYHIERGARTFAAYAKAMLGDMGEGIRPYLKQLYMALKFDPRANALDGLDSAAAVEAVDVNSIEVAAPAVDTGGKEDGNATRPLDRPSTGALEGAPAEDVRPAGEVRPDRGRPDESSRGDGGGDPRADDAGGDLAGSVGADPRVVPVPARGAGAAAEDAPKRRVSRAPRPDAGPVGLRSEQSGLIPEGGPTEAPNAAPIPAPQISAQDFTIEDDFALGEGGQKTKFKANVAAIRLLAELDRTGRLATPDEQQVLARYVGWGGLPQAFDATNADWAREVVELAEVLRPDDLAAARQSTRYAHYTSRPVIVDGIYAALRRFGFTGGKTLEAGAGVGNFLGLMPADMRSAGRFTAIEREPIAAGISRQLYPRQSVQRADFTEFKGNDAYFDAAVGNPPFASDSQVDASGRKHLSGLSLHNYFFAKSVDMLREGGVMAQVITNAFLDARTDRARKYISDRTVFLGAIRLPNNAFAKNAGTEVTTDLIFLQKRPDAEFGGKAARADAKRWLGVDTVTDKNGKSVALNQYFIDNPDMMLGDYGAFGSMYGPDFPALVARPGQDTLALLREAVEKLPAGVYRSIADSGTATQTSAAIVALKDPSVQEGGFFVEGGKLMQRLSDLGGEARAVAVTPATQWTEKTTLGEAGFERIKALATMRTTLRGLIAAEMADDDRGMGALRTALNRQYDAYRAEHGLINDPSTLRVFDDDPDFPLLASLEHNYTPGVGPAAAKRQGIKPTKSTARKGPIFDRRVVAARTQVQKVSTPADALAVSMAERGKLDAAYIGKLLDRDADDVLRELSTGDKPMLFRDPASDEYVLRDAYLSGNVRAKLAQAKAAGMSMNARALEEVQPADVGAHEIVARVGSPWVPETVYEDFAAELFGEGTRARVRYVKLNSSYQVDIRAGNDVAFRNTWGTERMNGADLFASLLNNRSIKVSNKDSDGKMHVDPEATEAANTKAAEIREKFSDWLFNDADRSEKLVRAYNDTNNNYVTRVYDGASMTFPGKVPDDVIKFRRHQRDAIARTVQDRTALYDHVVGAGKTFTVVASAMELKRTGLAAKNMVAVPNHLVKQWAADFYRLYPGANILTATKKDFEKANRRKFLAKIATGDWDAVVIAHSSFGFIRPAPEFEAEFNRQQVKSIVATINSVQQGDGDGPQKKRTVKQLEGLKEKLENRVKALRDKPMDDLLDFEQIGVDQLFVDEFHMFKNLMFSTKMQNVQGLGDSAGSQRAYDMYVKINQIFAKNGRDQGVVAATGTPVSNSLAEMYHMMRYLMPTQMRELGFESFDAWANTFASVEQVWMQKPSGDGFKASSRMSNFVNTPELLKMFDQVCDTVTMDDIKSAYREENDGAEFPLPKLKGDRRTPVSLDKTPAQEEFMKALAARAKKVEERKGPPQKGEDNVLVIMGDGRKAAMDIRLVDLDRTEREPGGRIDRASEEIASRYQKFHSVKGTQLVFSDLGTPIKHAKAELKEYEALQTRVGAVTEDIQASAALGSEAALTVVEDAEAAQAELDAKGSDWLDAVRAALRGFSVYDDLKAALVEKGIPEGEIAFIHDYNTDDQKASLFRKVNAGDIRVLLGSTAKMGAGTNVQERVVAEHHLDVPWRPSDVEQREGRVLRQGNRLMNEVPNFEVEILAYVTKDTLDMRMWQVQETKLKMINQLRTRKVGREIDNAFEDLELSAGEMQAAATGNIDLLHEIQLRADVKKLEQRKRSFDANRNELESRRRRNTERLADLPAKIASGQRDAEQVRAYYTEASAALDGFKATIDGIEFTDWRAAQRYLLGKTEATVETVDRDGNKQKRAAPIEVVLNGETYTARAALADAYSELRGDTDAIIWTLNDNTYRRRARIGTAIRQGVVDALADQAHRPIGSIAGYDVAVEGEVAKGGTLMLEVTLSRGGEVVKDQNIFVTDTGRAPESVIRVVDNMLNSLVSDQRYLQAQLDAAKKEKSDLASTEAAGEWPDQSKLDDARGRHKAVLARLAGKGTPGAAGEAEPAAFSRGDGGGMPASAVQQAIDEITAKWENAPPIVVARDMDDEAVPEAVRAHNAGQLSQGAEGAPKGFFYRGQVFVIADQMTSPQDVAEVVFHESLGHFGLRGAFGDSLKPILQQIAGLRRGDVAAKAREYGLDMTDERQRLQAAEEVLAEMAQLHPELGFVQRAIAAIRTWLRANVAALRSLELSDAEILRDYLLPARGWVQRGAAADVEMAPSAAVAYSRAQATPAGVNDPSDFRTKATQAVTDLFDAPGALNWWHKSVGTMHNLAQRSPQFKRVFDSVQTFLGDVSRYATEAADLAPRILPKLESWRDIVKSPLSVEDTKAIGAPVFEGTLAWARDDDGKLWKSDAPEAAGLTTGVVFTDAELKQHFGATAHQIGLYREFRAAINQSLNRVTISEMLRFGGADTKSMRDMAMDAASAEDASILLRDHLAALAAENPDRADLLNDTAAKIIEKADKVKGLIDHGYAPLSRFGHYTVDVLDEKGERAYFGMFESRGEANRMARRMRENYPRGEIVQGTVSEQAYKLFNGITPETLELFGEMVGLEAEGDEPQHQMFQQYLKLAKANRSAMKRLIHRKGIAGFSEDAGRVLAGFVYSNARLTSTNLNMGEIMKATSDVSKSDGELKDMAVKLADYVRNPQEEAQQIRGLLFAQYLGGSIASAMVNMTQPFAVTMPYLSQWGGAAKSAMRMKDALGDVLKKSTGDAKLDAALQRAEAEGIVAPQEVHQLMAQARGRAALQAGDGIKLGNARAGASNLLSRVSLAWGKPFSVAEQFNRRITFIAAYRTAVAEGIADPATFAAEAIANTQFVYNKGNKPAWARGAIGATLFTFKQYSISYAELLHRMATQGGPEGKKAALFALAMLFMMGGAGGLPFVGDAEDVVDGVMQRLGYSWSTKQARRQFLIDLVGEGAGEFIERGVSGLPGVPIDVAGRLGMGNLIPGTGLLTKKADYGRDFGELLGPAGDFVQRAFQGAGKVADGKPVEGLMMASPKATENLRKGIEMMQTGIYKDTKGRKVIDVDATDALVKMVGFQPTSVARVQEATFTQQNLIAQNRLTKGELADEMANAVYEKDLEKQQQVRERMQNWNRNNPTSPVTIDMAGVRRRVIAMRQDKATRLSNAAPKAIRSEVKKALAEGSV